MIINLPKEYYYKDKTGKLVAKVKNGTLHVYRGVNFEYVMIDLSYTLKGTDKCYYCGREINRKNVTADHVYPRMYGGITIPENIVPSCLKCNNAKASLLLEQFGEYNKIKNYNKRKKYAADCEKKNKGRLYERGFLLDESWIEYIDYDVFFDNWIVKEILASEKLHDQRAHSINGNIEFIEKYNNIKRPLIIDRNGFVICGVSQIYAIVETGLKKDIPVMRLCNVEIED